MKKEISLMGGFINFRFVNDVDDLTKEELLDLEKEFKELKEKIN